MVTILANRNNYGNSRTKEDIKGLVIHYTANNGDTARGNCNYFKNNVTYTSAHIFVDDNECIQSVPDLYVAWSVGANHYYHPYLRNDNTISIELCSRKDSKGNYYFTDQTFKNALEITSEYMKKYNIKIADVVRHYDITRKICPAPMVYNETLWDNFKRGLMAMEMGIKEMELDEAMKILQEKKIINTPEYWYNACKCVKYLEELIINVAKEVNKK